MPLLAAPRLRGASLQVLVLGVLFAGLSFAQSTARLSGSVVDPSDALIPGAKLACRHIATGIQHQTVTNAEGLFNFPELPIGIYQVTVSAPGFKTLVRDSLELLIGHVVDLRFTLPVGQVVETTEVVGEIALVQSASSEVQTTIDSRSMSELPLNGRNPLELVLLTPGTDISDTGTIVGQQDNQAISVNGLRGTDNNFQLDGAGFNNAHFGSAPTLPNPDTLGEFTVQSSNFNARQSRAGAVVQLSTRSGGNRLNGSAFEFLRNEDLDARYFFDAQKSQFRRSQAGGTLGGPIKRNRTFFFGSYQATIKRGAVSTKMLTVPSQVQRDGDFTALAARRIVDPLTNQLFPGSIIPKQRFDALAAKLLPSVPLPNVGPNSARVPLTQNQDDHQWLVKIDHRLGSSNQLSARYFWDQNRFQRDIAASVPQAYANNVYRNNILTISDTHTFGNSLTAIGSFSYSHAKRLQVPVAPFFNQDLTGKVPLGSAMAKPELRVTVSNYFSLDSGGALTFDPYSTSGRVQLAWTRRTHLVQFGVDIDFSREFASDTSLSAGTWTFGAVRTQNTTTVPGSVGDAFASYLLGLPSTFSQTGNTAQGLAEFKFQPWIQDDWKVRRNLTLNLGLRWEPWLPPVDHVGPLPGLMPGMQSRVAPDAPTGLIFSGDVRDSVYPRDWFNLGPRAGFAWSPRGNSRTVIRGGYGIYFRSPALNMQRHAANQAAFRTMQVSITNPPSFADPYANYPGGPPYPFKAPSASELASYKFVRPVTTAALDPRSKTSYTQNWNLTIERKVRGDLSMSLAYVGNHSINILAGTEGNPARWAPGATAGNTDARRIYPGLASVTYYAPWQWGIYHSLQLSVTKRTRRGLSLIGNYVWGKALDDGTNGTQGGMTGRSRDPFNPNLNKAVADTDISHRANVAFVYDLPRLSAGPPLLRTVANNWQLNTIVTAQSGRPFSVMSGTNRSVNGTGMDTADVLGGWRRPAGVDPVFMWFNTAAFAVTQPGSVGTAGRNILRGNARQVVNFSAFRNIRLTERLRAQLRFEAFNFFNHASFSNPVAAVNNVNFGKVQGAGDPRVIQLGLKLLF